MGLKSKERSILSFLKLNGYKCWWYGMSERCRSIIVSEDYADFIETFNERLDITPDITDTYCLQSLGNSYFSYHIALSDIEKLNYESYSYSSYPKLYGLMDTLSLENSGILNIRNQPSLALTGEGVIIGIIDTGIDYTNDIFIREDGTSRILAIWDQNDQTGRTPYDINYGSEYTNEEINYALKKDNPYDYVPQRDEIGHGTILASISAGNIDIENNFQGAAPKAVLGVVKLKKAKKYLRDFFMIDENATAYQENDIMMGMKYLDTLALKSQMPLVICLGLGTSFGDHAGNNYLSKLSQWVSNIRTRAIVAPTGNEANTRHHYFGKRENDEEYSEVELRANGESFTMELWGQYPDLFSVSVISPTGEIIPRVPVQLYQSGEYGFIFDKTIVEISYHLVEQSDGRQVIVIKFNMPTNGIWRIRVYYTNVIYGMFNIWLPIKDFLSEETYFLESNPYTTLTEPSASASVISVGGYNYINDSIYTDSGRGYNVQSAVKPDFVAPSVGVYSGRINSGFGYAQGTSAAAAITAGATAMMFEWGIVKNNLPNINAEDIKSILIRGARRSTDRTYPNREWGYGELDLLGSFRTLQIQ